jgi:hypothetical protein
MSPRKGAFLVADLPMVKNQVVRGATGDVLSVAMTQWRQPSELLSFIGERCAGGTKTTSKCCFWTTGEVHLMSQSESDGEFSERVTEASESAARRAHCPGEAATNEPPKGGFFC